MISSDSMRGFNDILILLVLTRGDNYGYEISKEIDGLSKGVYRLKETTLYSAIKRLEKKGLIYGYEPEETFGRKRTNYSISPQGESFLLDRLEEWQEISILMENFLEYGGLK